MLPDIVLIGSIVGAALFVILYLVSLNRARKLDKHSRLSKKRREKLVILTTTYEAAGTPDVSDNESDEEKSRRKSKHHDECENTHRIHQIRNFHRSVAAVFATTVCLALALYHMGVASEAVFVVRTSDAKVVNPWRYWFALALASSISYAYVSFAFQHRTLTALLISVHGALANLLLGVAVLHVVGSWPFWAYVVGYALATAVAAYLIYWHDNKHVAAQNGIVAGLASVYIPVSGVVTLVLFLGSYAVFGWFSFTTSLILDIVADVLLFAIPAILLLSEAYYRRRWALYPRALYSDYGLDEYWLLEAHHEHLEVLHKMKK